MERLKRDAAPIRPWKRSLAFNTMLRMSVRVSVVIIVASLLSYLHLMKKIELGMKEQLSLYASERARSESQWLVFLEDNLQQIRADFIERFKRIGTTEPLEQFDYWFQINEDRTGYTRAPFYSGTPGPLGAMLSGYSGGLDNEYPLGPVRQNVLVLAMDVLVANGPAIVRPATPKRPALTPFVNLYFYTPEKDLVIYWPGTPWHPDFQGGFDLATQGDFSKTIDTTLPMEQRDLLWTGTYMDEVPKVWMVSYTMPIDLDGKCIAGLGADISLTEINTRLRQDQFQGAANYIVRRDGQLIAAPNLASEMIAKKGDYLIPRDGTSDLREAYDLIAANPGASVLDDAANDRLIGIGDFAGPDWLFVSIFPKATMKSAVAETVLFVFLLAVISLFIEVGLLWFVLRKQVAAPLNQFIHATEVIGDGNSDSEAISSLPMERQDEIGKLAHAFSDMAESLAEFREKRRRDAQRLGSLLNQVGKTKDFTLRAQVSDENDEVGQIGLRFNEMLSQVQERDVELAAQRDTLERKVEERTADLARAKEVAESASRAKSMFLANMSHEIRTPMNAVLGFAQILERDPALSPDARSKVSIILQSGDHLLAIINDILEMSRIEAGRLELRTQPVDLKALLHDVAELFQIHIDEKGLEFHLELAPDLPHHIVTDLAKLRQIAVNLLNNAVKYTGRGAITMSACAVGQDRCRIAVQDTGIGIGPDELSILFEPFERTRSGEAAAGGTGLGLAICRKYARLMGGEITVESHPGEGSRFSFEFHAVTVSAAQPEKTGRRAYRLAEAAVRVLVVDDVALNRDLLRQLLEPAGFIVEEVPDGAAAIARAQAFKPRVILMDLIMPGMTGIEAAQILRSSGVGSSTAIIGISASAFDEERGAFLAAGGNAFIPKPFREEELFEVLMRIGGIAIESEDLSPNDARESADRPAPSLEKLPATWIEAFSKALAQGSVGQLRNLGEEAALHDPALSAYILDRVAHYDLAALKRLCAQGD